ncbi:hypothetical protein [Sulfurimonas sp.]|uniref:hypothetical protein n=1 Tax=Sulfurimonas sp. TaxID=2022749 RepID=UPI002AB10EF5|nr:hypothetical protein [Sulfurimonas sp.]
MDVSSSTQQTPVESGTNPLEKAIDVQEKQIEKIIESSSEQSKQVNAQKTGIGSNINIIG